MQVTRWRLHSLLMTPLYRVFGVVCLLASTWPVQPWARTNAGEVVYKSTSSATP